MSNLTSAERINLKELVGKMEADDNTESIRSLKHSTLIGDDIRTMEILKTSEYELRKWDFAEFTDLCQSKCAFLYNNYTDIFNKVLNNELDLTIMKKLLIILKLIEDEKVDQHEGSAMVGKILKELYLDSAIKKADNLDKKYQSDKPNTNDGKPVTWKQYKSKLI
jgi:hypothetical protein